MKTDGVIIYLDEIDLGEADYWDYPPKEPVRWTMHYHIRGPRILFGEEEGFYIKHPLGNYYITRDGKMKKVKQIPPGANLNHSSHIDFRIEYGDYLIGWTLATGNTGDDMLKITQVSSKKKMYALTKAPEPLAWLEITSWRKPVRIAPRGSVGATRKTEGIFIHLDNGILWPGSLKPTFVEYFMKGKLLEGRFVLRQTTLKIIDPDLGKTDKESVAWLFWRPDDQMPYILSRRAKRKGYVPPKGEFPIAPEHIDQYPRECLETLEYLLERWYG